MKRHTYTEEWYAEHQARVKVATPVAAVPTKKPRERHGKKGGVAQLLRNEPGRIALLLPILIESEQNRRDYWRTVAKRKKLQREEVRIEWRRLVGNTQVGLPCTVKLTRYGVRYLDEHENLRSGFKYVVDEIARIIGVDDADPRVTWEYAQAVSEVRIYKVEIEITWKAAE